MNENLGTSFTHIAFPPDRKKRSIFWHIYILPAHILRLIAFLDLDARRIVSLRNGYVQFYLSTIAWIGLAVIVLMFHNVPPT